MWIDRKQPKSQFLHRLALLNSQVLIVRGARQVGKTSFILNALEDFQDHLRVDLNLASARSTIIKSRNFHGRDFFGKSESGEDFLKNLELTFGDLTRLKKPIIVFMDEADSHPAVLESVQSLAEHASLKVILTGSNLENIATKNAATGRKDYFDLFPITFQEFLGAHGKNGELDYLLQISEKPKNQSDHFHQLLLELFDLYLRLGGMPKILDTFLDGNRNEIPHVVSSLIESIEENVKSVLGEKSRLYEYEDILRKLAQLSLETLKISKLQVQHVGRLEAKKIINKTVGARVAHKIRLYEAATDLSKYILFDVGVLNFLLNGSDLLTQKLPARSLGIQHECAVGTELIAALPSRDDLHYWKSERGAQVEYTLKSPRWMAIDVKTTRGDTKSLDSCAIFEKEIDLLVKFSRERLTLHKDHVAKLPNMKESRAVPLLTIPHYLGGRLLELAKLSAV